MITDYRALCVELTDRLEHAITSVMADSYYGENRDAVDRARAALAQPEPVALSPKEVEAQEAFTQLRDEILHLSDGLEVNEVLGIIDNHTPEWV